MNRTIAKLFTAAFAVGVGIACTNSGLVGGTDTDLLTNPTNTNPTNTNPTGGSECDTKGTWVLSKAWCGTFEIDTDWFAVYSDSEMRITDTGDGDGSCNVDFTWTGSECAEEEEWEITSTAGGAWSIRFGGIASCAPDQCTFYPSDDTCLIGARTQATPLDFDVETLQPTQIRITGLFGDDTVWEGSGYPQCTLDLTTEWLKE